MANANMHTNCCVERPQVAQQTIGQAYDVEIQRLKRQLERVTIAKAKAETLGMLDYPAQDLRAILGYVI